MTIKKTDVYGLDDADRRILRILQTDGNAGIKVIAKRINLSPPAVHVRLKRLESKGYIQQYLALLDREKVGFDLLCFIHVSMQLHKAEAVEAFAAAVQKLPEVLECFQVTGEYDYLLKVVFRDRQHLQQFLNRKLIPLAGGVKVQTSLALNQIKATTALPLE
jgi:DNA-binding Lrp family transcriptional regulator